MVVVEVSPSPSPFDVEKSRVWNMGSICKCCGVCVWIVEIALGVFYRGPKSIQSPVFYLDERSIILLAMNRTKKKTGHQAGGSGGAGV